MRKVIKVYLVWTCLDLQETGVALVSQVYQDLRVFLVNQEFLEKMASLVNVVSAF